ncbi:MAG TPA: aldo/keto reductase [Acidobacteriota bacterium]|nr:aldo/keto reductase [Acidobacteriota bacterium]
MRTQSIGASVLRSSRLAYGCMRVSGTWERAEFTPALETAGRAAILAAYEAGYTHFDHADIYGRGLCEEAFGRVLRGVPGMRDRIVIATKCGIRWRGDPDEAAPHRYDFSREHILRSCEGSLRRLGIDRIDLYMLHRPDYLADPDEIAAAFADLKQEGKVLEFGVSNFRPSLLSAIRRACPMPLVAHQVEIHLGRLECFEDGTLDQCLEHAITPASWSPLAGGMLGEGGQVDPGDPRAPGLRALLEVLDSKAKDHGVTRAVVALAWLLRHPAGIIPIVGSVKPDRIRDAATADDFEMSREDWYDILRAARMQPLP